jgi:excisionase family DNA binding protein
VRLLARQAASEALTTVEVAADAPPAEPLLTVEQVAENLGCSVRSIRRMIDLGEFTVVRIGRLVRVDPGDLRRSIAARRNV